MERKIKFLFGFLRSNFINKVLLSLTPRQCDQVCASFNGFWALGSVTKFTQVLGLGGGEVFSVFTFNSDDTSSNPTVFFRTNNFCLRRTNINKKEAVLVRLKSFSGFN